MKFSEKLQNLRKEFKLSQEDLAGTLDVSRQAVSKWESGHTYPEMDKLIALTKIFKCSLDDLTNDDVTEVTVNGKNKNSGTTFIGEVLDIINKSISMFRNMSAKEIAKCITIMFLVLMILLFLQIPVNYIYELGTNIFRNFGNDAEAILSSIWYFILECSYLILAAMLFVYIYKIRFLDNFNENEYEKKESVSKSMKKSKNVSADIIESEDNVITEKIEEKSFIENKNNKGGISKIFSVFGNLFSFFLKGIMVMIAVPFSLLLIFLFVCVIIWFGLLFKGVVIVGALILIIAAIILTILFIELLYNFIVNKNIAIKRTIITFLISMAFIGSGIGLCLIYVSDFKYIDEVPANLKKNLETKEIEMTKDLVLSSSIFYNDDVKYTEDNKFGNKIEIKTTYFYDFSRPIVIVSDNVVYIPYNDINGFFQTKPLNLFISDLKKKELRNYDLLFNFGVEIVGSKANLEKLKENSKKYEEEVNYYEIRINELENEVDRLETELENANYEKDEISYEYQEKIDELNNKLQEYKDHLSDILN